MRLIPARKLTFFLYSISRVAGVASTAFHRGPASELEGQSVSVLADKDNIVHHSQHLSEGSNTLKKYIKDIPLFQRPLSIP